MSFVKKSLNGDFYKGANIFDLPNGDTYLGEYLAHVSGVIWREGAGVYQTEDGQFYEGNWRDDNLIDGEETTITYPDKSQYQGPLVKNKYHGPCSFTLCNGKQIFTECNANKVIGDVSLADVDGRLWHGTVAGESAFLYPENLFFQNITPHRGKWRDLIKDLEPDFTEKRISKTKSSSSTANKIDRHDSELMKIRELEREKIFGKASLKIPDYTDSSWYRNFDDYKKMRTKILDKIANGTTLSKQEMKWYNKYAWSKKKVLDCTKNKPFPPTDASLLDKFHSKEFKESSKPYRVIYPSVKGEKPESLDEETVLEETVPKIEEEEVELSVYAEEEEVEEEQEKELEKERSDKVPVSVGTDSLFDFVDTIFKKKTDRKCNENLWTLK